MIELILAILAGILTIAAPCILLPLPILLGSSIGYESKTRPAFIALGFVTTFTILALTLNFIIRNLGLSANTLRNGAAFVLGLFAVFMIWPSLFEKMMVHFFRVINSANKAIDRANKDNFGGFLIGMLIGIIWAPCAGPILGSILTLIARQQDLARAGILLAGYALGAGLPMLLIAYASQAVTTKIKQVAKYSVRIQQIFGVIILLLAIAIFFQYDTLIQIKLLDKLPSLNPKF